MRRLLVLCNTYYQFLTALQLSRTSWREDEVDFVLTDHTPGLEAVAGRLEEEWSSTAARNVYFVKNADFNKSSELNRLVGMLFPKRVHAYFAFEKEYDILCLYNLDVFANMLFTCMEKKNPRTRVWMFEEGYSVYLRLHLTRNIRLVSGLLQILGRPALYKRIDKLYLYHPELMIYQPSFILETIPPLDKQDKAFTGLLNRLFAYEPHEDYSAVECIIMEQPFELDGASVDDTTLIQSAAELAGLQKTWIKQHPRSPKDRFRNLHSVHMDIPSVPWEIVQLNHDFSGVTLVTVASSGVLTPKLLFGETNRIIFLFRMLPDSGRGIVTPNAAFLKRFKESFGEVDMCFPENLEQLKKCFE